MIFLFGHFLACFDSFLKSLSIDYFIFVLPCFCLLDKAKNNLLTVQSSDVFKFELGH